jgi:hypothetical protein
MVPRGIIINSTLRSDRKSFQEMEEFHRGRAITA